jgi:hypothetical protein
MPITNLPALDLPNLYPNSVSTRSANSAATQAIASI